jgi:endonuclease/exonuclease/phosphatase family metal-dependent hydrolase
MEEDGKIHESLDDQETENTKDSIHETPSANNKSKGKKGRGKNKGQANVNKHVESVSEVKNNDTSINSSNIKPNEETVTGKLEDNENTTTISNNKTKNNLVDEKIKTGDSDLTSITNENVQAKSVDENKATDQVRIDNEAEIIKHNDNNEKDIQQEHIHTPISEKGDFKSNDIKPNDITQESQNITQSKILDKVEVDKKQKHTDIDLNPKIENNSPVNISQIDLSDSIHHDDANNNIKSDHPPLPSKLTEKDIQKSDIIPNVTNPPQQDNLLNSNSITNKISLPSNSTEIVCNSKELPLPPNYDSEDNPEPMTHDHIPTNELHILSPSNNTITIDPETQANYIFSFKGKLKYGEAVYVSGSNEELGSWQLNNSIRLNVHGENVDQWITQLPIKYKNFPFEYKYFIAQYKSHIDTKHDKVSWIGLNNIKVLKHHFHMIASRNSTRCRVMSMNIRYINDTDGIKNWDNRKDLVLEIINRSNSDLIGLQEACLDQVKFLEESTNSIYFDIGRPRTCNIFDEQCRIFYNHQKFFLNEWGQFWLSDTPDLEGSISFGNAFPRIVTWARFSKIDDIIIDNGTNHPQNEYYMFNTHLDHKSKDSRLPCVKVLVQEINKITSRVVDTKFPDKSKYVFITGSFYSDDESDTIIYLKELGYVSASPNMYYDDEDFTLSQNTYHEFTGVGKAKYDYILYKYIQNNNNIKNSDVCHMGNLHYEVINDIKKINNDGSVIYPSDHFPIFAEIGLN